MQAQLDDRRRALHPGRIIAAALVALAVGALLGSGSLVGLAERQPLGGSRDAALATARAVDRVAHFLSLNRPAAALATALEGEPEVYDVEALIAAAQAQAADGTADPAGSGGAAAGGEEGAAAGTRDPASGDGAAEGGNDDGTTGGGAAQSANDPTAADGGVSAGDQSGDPAAGGAGADGAAARESTDSAAGDPCAPADGRVRELGSTAEGTANPSAPAEGGLGESGDTAEGTAEPSAPAEGGLGESGDTAEGTAEPSAPAEGGLRESGDTADRAGNPGVCVGEECPEAGAVDSGSFAGQECPGGGAAAAPTAPGSPSGTENATAATPSDPNTSGTPSAPGSSGAPPAPGSSPAVGTPGQATDGTPGFVGPRSPTVAEPLRIYVGGDSISRDLGEGLARRAPADLVVVDLDPRPATGLSRPDFFDWAQHLAGVLTGAEPEVIVVLFGANDFQNVEHEGAVLDRFSPEWLDLYRQRVNRIMTLLGQPGVQTIWVGQPPVRESRLAGGLARLNGVYAEVAAAHPQVTFVDTWKWFSGAGGGYTDEIDGVRVRREDGVHLTIAGGNRLGEVVWAEIAPAWSLP